MPNETWTVGPDVQKVTRPIVTGAGSGPGVKSMTAAVIGEGCSIVGKIRLSDDTTISGIIEGDVSSTAELTIGESAEITAAVTGVVIKVFGKVVGNINCSERLELHSGAQVTGDISTPALIIRDGVVFEGRCSMKETQGQTSSKSSSRNTPKILEFRESSEAGEPNVAGVSISNVGNL